MEARVQRAAHAGGDECAETVVVREGRAEGGALLEAEGGEVRVGQGFVFGGEVVVALGVADEVDCGRHFLCVACICEVGVDMIGGVKVVMWL